MPLTVNSANTKKQLVDYLTLIQECLDVSDPCISTEKDLEEFVQVVPNKVRQKRQKQGGATNPTLLEILGYDDDTCEDHNTKKVGHTNFIPDYVCGTPQKTWMVFDLKAPDVNLNGNKMADFIQSYCRTLHPPAPLGALYNGYSIRVFINPEYPGFGKYLKLKDEQDRAKTVDFYQTPVASVDAINISEMAKILLQLDASSLSEGAVKTARRLADAVIRGKGDAAEQGRIRETVKLALQNPSDDVIVALAGVDALWEDYVPKPLPNEVLKAWKKREEQPLTVASVRATAKQSINGLLRQRVAEACEAKGWDYVQSRPIKGFRHRSVGGNGYYLVPQGDAVPLDLYVAGVPTADAELIISQLEQITKP